MPEIVEAIAFWQGMNDVYQFAICFMTHAIFEDDFRKIRTQLEKSLKGLGLFETWRTTPKLDYLEFMPPASPPVGPGAAQSFSGPH
jgi:hypothetical protein